MTLVRSNLTCTKNCGVVGGGTNGVPLKEWAYTVGPAGAADVADNLATVAAAPFFGPVVVEGVINDGDKIVITATDGRAEGTFDASGVSTTINVVALDIDPTV
jgi:hypothetical protein